MTTEKTKKFFFSPVWLLALATAAFFLAPTGCQALEITIDVSPNTLIIQSNSTVLTVHTNIDFHAVNAPTVTLDLTATDFDPVPISWWKEDDCGNFVAKFSMDDIKAQLGPDDYDKLTTFILEGETTSGETFSGRQEISIVSNEPRKR